MPNIYRQLFSAFLLIWLMPVMADDSLRSFTASYHLFKNDKQVGEVILGVEKSESRLRWHSTTIPSGLYALITSKQPYSESILTRSKGDFRLTSLKLSTDVTDAPLETASFDWQKAQMLANRKNKEITRRLSSDVYDYLSIHWLAAQLSLAEADKYQLTFYRKGKLVSSTLTRRDNETVEIGDQSIEAQVFEQNFEGSSRQLTYHYGQTNRWLPLRIERIRKGKKKTTMHLKSLDGLN